MCVITPFAILAVFAFVWPKTIFTNVDLVFPSFNKNEPKGNFSINQCFQTPDSHDQSSAIIHPKCNELQKVERTAQEASIVRRDAQTVSQNTAG
jgi:hypothetical protein